MLTVAFDFQMLAGEPNRDVLFDLFGSRQHEKAPRQWRSL
jgi:hypothetical protein